MILIRFNFLQVFPPATTFVFATSFRGFSPTRPTERERGRVGEILGNEVVVFALLFKKKKNALLFLFTAHLPSRQTETANLVPRVLSYPPYPLSLSLSLSLSLRSVGRREPWERGCEIACVAGVERGRGRG